MRILKYLALIVLFSLLVSAIPLALITHSLGTTLLDADFYTTEFDKYDLYQIAQQQIQAQLPVQGLKADQLSEVISEDWAKQTLGYLIGQHLKFLKGEDAVLVATVDLSYIRLKAKALLTQIMAQQLIAQMPAGADLSLSNAIIAQANVQVTEMVDKSIPESLNVAYYTSAQASMVRPYIAMFRQISTYLLVAFGLLFIFTALVAWAPASILRWNGVALTLGGGATYVALTFGLAQAAAQIGPQLAGTPVPPQVVSGLLADIFAPAVTYGKYLAILGLLMLVASFFVHLLPLDKLQLNLPKMLSKAEAPKDKTEEKPAEKTEDKTEEKPPEKEKADEKEPADEKKEESEKKGDKKPKGKCPKCGASVAKSDDFCPECGKKLKN